MKFTLSFHILSPQLFYVLSLACIVVLFFTGCVTTRKGIVYDKEQQLALDIYQPKQHKDKKDVLIFIHGGNWKSGKRSTYKFFGKGFAKKGIVTVVIDYRLSNATTVHGMAQDVARSVKWVKENIPAYGGDDSRIFLSGHSSGGHLAALVALDQSYLKEAGAPNSVKGVILIDAFGLNMYDYLKKSRNEKDSIYFPAFTKDPENWKKWSPLNYIQADRSPFLLFLGGKTYPAIKIYSVEFWNRLKEFQPGCQLIEQKGKRHVPMIGQFYNPWNHSYNRITEFMSGQK